MGELDIVYADCGAALFLPLPRGAANAPYFRFRDAENMRAASMIQAAVTGERGPREYAAGSTMRGGETAESMRILTQAGWYRDERGNWENPGDWEVNPHLFPAGIREFTREVRAAGMRPGIWFEWENLSDDRKVFTELNDCLLRLDGHIVKRGNRCFLDFRQPKVRAHLRQKVIDFLRENEFGYMKVDYNENIGLGCDGAESPGEGLRAHIEAVLDFFAEIRRALPDLVLEICASGGMRHEPRFIRLAEIAYAFSLNCDARFSFSLPAAYEIKETFGLLSAEVRDSALTLTGQGEPFGGLVVLRKR